MERQVATHDSLDFTIVDQVANEVLLLHGTPPANASQIVMQGFDDCLVSRGLYGSSIYFITDISKALEYCSEKNSDSEFCLLVSRVVLGHAYGQ